MKEATLKKYNKTQLETYAKKAKDQNQILGRTIGISKQSLIDKNKRF